MGVPFLSWAMGDVNVPIGQKRTCDSPTYEVRSASDVSDVRHIADDGRAYEVAR